MAQNYLTELKIINVRHLHNIRIPLSQTERKHLILTGKNGSGKTSLLRSISSFLDYLVSEEYRKDDSCKEIDKRKDKLQDEQDEDNRRKLLMEIRDLDMNARDRWNNGCVVNTNDAEMIRSKYNQGKFILAHCTDDRQFKFNACKDLSRDEPNQVISIHEHPAKDFGKYLANQMSALAFAQMEKNQVRAKEIEQWFKHLEEALGIIYDTEELKLDFDSNTYRFSILIPDRDPIPLEHMSMGYAAMLDIIAELIMRMANDHTFDTEGIVLIDEVENHLHVSLQQKVMPILIKLFPKIQFIVTSHSPFVLNSTEHAVIYDLGYSSDNCKPADEEDMTNATYSWVLERHFCLDNIPHKLRTMLDEYKKESTNGNPNSERIQFLEDTLDAVPEFLCSDFFAEYEAAKLDAKLYAKRNKVKQV